MIKTPGMMLIFQVIWKHPEQPCHFPSATIKDENRGASAGQSSSQQNGALSPVPNMSGGILVPRIVTLGYVEEHAEQLL